MGAEVFSQSCVRAVVWCACAWQCLGWQQQLVALHIDMQDDAKLINPGSSSNVLWLTMRALQHSPGTHVMPVACMMVPAKQTHITLHSAISHVTPLWQFWHPLSSTHPCMLAAPAFAALQW
jgi:hypothetical protein